MPKKNSRKHRPRKVYQTIVTDPRMVRRRHRLMGKRMGRRTRVTIAFDLLTPVREYIDPALDEVLLLDLLDHIQQYVMEFHDIPGFKLTHYSAGGRLVV